MLKEKRAGTELGMKVFNGEDGKQYLVFRSGRKYHVFVEVEAKEAARQCGAKEKPKGPAMWDGLWENAK